MATKAAATLSAKEQVEALAIASRKSPIAFSELAIALSGHQIRRHPFQELMMRFILACVAEKRNILIQAPPEHAKTSLVIPFLVWTLAQDTRKKIGFVSADKDLAEEHLVSTRKLMTSPLCRAAFPEMRPDVRRSGVDRGKWSSEKLYLEGRDRPAFETYSLYGPAEGHRLDFILADDCVTRDCVDSPAARKKSADALFLTFGNRLTDVGTMLVLNNNWHRDDAVHKMRASPSYSTLWIGYRDVDALAWTIHNPPPGWNEESEGEFPLWSHWPRARLIQKRGEPGDAWVRLFEGRDVQPEDARFPGKEHWKRWTWSDLGEPGQIHAFLDPAGGRHAHKGDYASLILGRERADGTTDLIDCWVARKPPSAQIEACFTLHEKWARLGFGGIFALQIEMLSNTEDWICPSVVAHQEKLRASGSPYWQLPWSVCNPTENKASRIEKIGPPLEHGWLRFPEDLEKRMQGDSQDANSWRRLVLMLEEWPYSAHDDAPDAIAGMLEVGGRNAKAESGVMKGIGVF